VQTKVRNAINRVETLFSHGTAIIDIVICVNIKKWL